MRREAAMSTIPNPLQNRLLAALPTEVYERLMPHLVSMHMPVGKVLYEAGNPEDYVYFPTDCIISLLYVVEDDASTEISVVGKEGIVGVAVLIIGGESITSQAIVQSAGHAYRLSATRLKHEFDRHGALFHLLLRYSQALIRQMAQNAVCNRFHTINQQLCRWLLLSLDRLSNNQLAMTQELIANLLSVRRERIMEAASKLQRLGLINYQDGLITVVDRPRLEELCCECYTVDKTEGNRLLAYGERPLPH